MVYKTVGKKSEQRKTFNLRISWVNDRDETVVKRYFTKIQAASELGISYTSICRKLKGMSVPKYAYLTIQSIREPAQVGVIKQLYC